MEIKEIRKLSSDKVRMLCIKKNWYTCGTNEDYAKMLAATDKEDITANDIYDIAIDIINHSNLKDYAKSCGMSINSNDFIECIMYEIGELVRTFYEIQN